MTVWLFGDSIFRGAVLDRFPDQYAPEAAAAEPLWPLRAPAETMNLLLGEEAVRLGGFTGLPDRVDKAARRLRTMLDAGTIAPGDMIVMLDVGPHACDPDRHEAQWRRLREAAAGAHRVRLVICEGFDGGARGETALRHDLAFGARSHNDAVAAAASSAAEEVGETRFLRLSAPLSAFDQALKKGFGIGAYRPDGVHLNVWGQLRLCALILAAALPGRRLDPGPLLALPPGVWEAAGAPATATADAMVRLALDSEGG